MPCHRVVAADLTIGGFGGRNAGAQVKRKRQMLEAEGVTFDRRRAHRSGLRSSRFSGDRAVAREIGNARAFLCGLSCYSARVKFTDNEQLFRI